VRERERRRTKKKKEWRKNSIQSNIILTSARTQSLSLLPSLSKLQGVPSVGESLHEFSERASKLHLILTDINFGTKKKKKKTRKWKKKRKNDKNRCKKTRKEEEETAEDEGNSITDVTSKPRQFSQFRSAIDVLYFIFSHFQPIPFLFISSMLFHSDVRGVVLFHVLDR